MNLSLLFLKKFFTQPLFNASIRPTNDRVAKNICTTVGWSTKKIVLELWPWTGPITKHISEHLNEDSVYYWIEYDSEYVHILRETYRHKSNMHFIQWDVKDLSKVMQELGIDHVDIIISTLPYKPILDNKNLLYWIQKSTNRGAQFRGISYSPFIFKKVYKLLCPRIILFSWKNIPPVYILWVN